MLLGDSMASLGDQACPLTTLALSSMPWFTCLQGFATELYGLACEVQWPLSAQVHFTASTFLQSLITRIATDREAVRR